VVDLTTEKDGVVYGELELLVFGTCVLLARRDATRGGVNGRGWGGVGAVDPFPAQAE